MSNVIIRPKSFDLEVECCSCGSNEIIDVDEQDLLGAFMELKEMGWIFKRYGKGKQDIFPYCSQECFDEDKDGTEEDVEIDKCDYDLDEFADVYTFKTLEKKEIKNEP